MTLTLTHELEVLLDLQVRDGRFSSREEAAVAALSNAFDPEAKLTHPERVRRADIRSKSLVDLFKSSPFADTDIEFQREPSPFRAVSF